MTFLLINNIKYLKPEHCCLDLIRYIDIIISMCLWTGRISLLEANPQRNDSVLYTQNVFPYFSIIFIVTAFNAIAVTNNTLQKVSFKCMLAQGNSYFYIINSFKMEIFVELFHCTFSSSIMCEGIKEALRPLERSFLGVTSRNNYQDRTLSQEEINCLNGVQLKFIFKMPLTCTEKCLPH